MKKVLLMLVFVLSAVCAYGQLGIKLESDHPSYLRYEPIRVRVTLSNLSGNTLVFKGDTDRENGRLIFNITTFSGRLVHTLDLDANPLADLILAPNETRALYLKLNALYDLQRADTYHVTAIVKHNRMASAYKSNTLNMEIREGLHEIEKFIGLPTASPQDMISQMQISLIRFITADASLYCLRAEDTTHVYGTFRIGPFFMGAMKPQMEIENGNTVHLLIQVAPRLYCYTTFSISGKEVRKRQQVYYTAMGGNPRLSRETGFLKVHNVKIARMGVDYKKEDTVVF